MNLQRDPLQTIAEAVAAIVQPFGVKQTILGWPDKSKFSVDNALPLLAIFPVHDGGKHQASSESIHATVDNGDGTMTVYREKLRKEYLLQFSIFTYTEEDRSNIGWLIEQHFTTNRQLHFGIPGVETGIFTYRGQRNPPGEPRFFQRDMQFQVTARVLDASTAYPAKTIQTNQTVSVSDPVPAATTRNTTDSTLPPSQ